MRNLQLTPLAKARVWFGHTVTSGFVPEGVLAASCAQAVEAPPLKSTLVVGVEALVPRGARAEFGLLAATFVPRVAGPVDIEVPYSGAEGTAWTASLAGALDDVRVGLPVQYASAVLESLSLTAVGRLPSGLLRISESAHGAVGSSPRFFGRLARAALDLVALNGAEVSEERLVTLMRGVLVD